MATFSFLRDASLHIKYGRNKKTNDEKHLKISSLYCLKALGAFFVICVHCFGPWPIFPIIRTAVPFFFIISGFFLYNDDPDKALNKSIKSLKKIFWITLYANIFYYICFFVPVNVLPFKKLISLISGIAIGNTLSMHLWYLNAYLETIVIVLISLKLKTLKYLWWCIPLCILCGLITGKYGFLFPYLPNKWSLSSNFITVGIPCFGIGWLLKKYSSKLLDIFKHPIPIAIILLILSELEIFFLEHTGHFITGDYVITTFPLAASLILIGVKYPQLGKDTIIEHIGKKYSTHIYIFHVFVLRMFIILNNRLLGFPSITFPFIVFILTILFTIVWEKCSRQLFNN